MISNVISNHNMCMIFLSLLVKREINTLRLSKITIHKVMNIILFKIKIHRFKTTSTFISDQLLIVYFRSKDNITRFDDKK